MFGRKGLNRAPPKPQPSELSGHANVLDHLRREEAKGDLLVRPQVAARGLFDGLYYRMATPELGTRIEDMLAVLGACGGFSCIVAVQHALRQSGQTPKEIGMMVVETKDGQTYYFGEAPNSLLIESHHSLLSLTLGAAHALGAPVSLERVQEVCRRTAQLVGSPDFGAYTVAEKHRPSLPLREAVERFWPLVCDALDLYEVAPGRRPVTIGFAVQQAIDTGKSVLDPLIAADIVAEAAVPAAKLDPADFGVTP